MNQADPFFTLVFRGDLRLLDRNVFLTDTPFGRAVAASVADALADVDKAEGEASELTDYVCRLEAALWEIAYLADDPKIHALAALAVSGRP